MHWCRFQSTDLDTDSDSKSPIMPSLDSFKTRTSLTVGADTVSIFSLPALETASFPASPGCRIR